MFAYSTADDALRALHRMTEGATPRGVNFAALERRGGESLVYSQRADLFEEKATERADLALAIGRVEEPHRSLWILFVLGSFAGGWIEFARYASEQLRLALDERACRRAVSKARQEASFYLDRMGLLV